MKEIEQLAEMSRFYGGNPDFIIAGGGNSSYKNDEYIWVKPSGVPLATIQADDFAVLRRNEVAQIMAKHYPDEVNAREAQVKDDLMASSIHPEKGLRPSVETSLHEAIKYPFVMHTHSYVLNALLCSEQAREKSLELFGEGAVYIEYTDPGYVLSRKVFDTLNEFRKTHEGEPNIILLENHGVFVGGNTIQEIRDIYTDAVGVIERHFEDVPSSEPDREEAAAGAIMDQLKTLRPNSYISHKTSPLIRYFQEPDRVGGVSYPLIPDQIVYCKPYPAYLENFNGKDGLKELDQAFKMEHGYPFKILLINGSGLFAIEESKQSAELALKVFEDWMKVSYCTQFFGGPHFLSQQEIDFIDNWEVENYRRKVAKS